MKPYLLFEERVTILQQAFSEIPLCAKQHHDFFQMWKERPFDKHQYLSEAGSVAKHFCIVVSGVQALYVIDTKGKKVVLGFSFKGSFSGDYASFLGKKPTELYVEVLTESLVLSIDYRQYHSLFEQYPEFERWGRLMHQQILLGRLSREVELLTADAKTRYISFMKRCPPQLKTIPQKYLASYLNMTPETFSRLRATVKY